MTRILATAVALVCIALGGITMSVSARDLADDGKKLYTKHKCSKCHRIGRVGAKKGPLDGVASKLTEAEIREWLTSPAEMEAQMDEPPEGTNSMANTMDKKPLAPDEVDAVTAYMMTLTD